ncbi:DctP family TRAP transporter solute-binding subunit [Sporosarcina sp. GW1-11]|uniref:TRAP transporter substrate-binding protein n=1 Tax=Sporosarcina sp. GW1-11 TaxID=2899126 RepID=UPI00294F98F4|nr:DctP family TRAP transporter solute-binding subunit [Sporosarcina sp. GW1-11]MDV6378643.1 DctP family TRAP transporter solute-binding subunit [Sporosarcina sp. GW1-11]
MLKKFKLGLIASVVSVVVLAGCGNEGESGKDSEQVKIQLGHALSEGTPASDLLNEMAKNVEEKTEGRVDIDVFPNSQLGSETEMLEQLKLGTMEAGAIMVGTMQSLDKKMAIEDLPYMWKDIDHARAAYNGEFGDYLANVMNEQGMKKIGYLEWGFRHVTNNKRPIVEPEDMKGLSIRVAESNLRIDAFEQLGALPTVMAFSEVYGALQQGALDAQENPLANIVAPKFDEVQKYLSLTGHFYNTIMMVVDNDVWDTISEEDQKIILEESDRISKEVLVKNDEMEDGYIKTLEERGMQINDDVDTKAFREAMLPVYDKWEEAHFGKELMDIYREASGW